MYENYSRQSLPTKEYRALLGSAICVFNSNNGFIIENILRTDPDNQYTWHQLIDKTSGELLAPIKETITKTSNTDIATLFGELVFQRNRIVHSFRITSKDDAQILCTKDKKHKQFDISEDYLLAFIKKNEELAVLLHDFRGDKNI